MSLLDLPNELLFHVASDLDKGDIYSLLLTSRYFTSLTPRFHKFACESKYCITALYLAATNRNEYMIRLLLNKAPPMLIQRSPSEEPSNLACLTKDKKDAVVKHLLEKGPESIILDTHLRTAVYLAVESRKKVMTKHLLSKGAHASSPNYISRGPIYAAIRNRDQHMIRLLLKNGANIEGHHSAHTDHHQSRRDKNFTLTPLMYAARTSTKGIVKMLVKMGADINARESGYWTVLFILILVSDLPDRERRDMVGLLLELGADPNARDMYGRTVLDAAETQSSKAMCSLLQSYGAIHRWSLEKMGFEAEGGSNPVL